MSGAPLLVIAAGGTGGHMFPAQALAEAMVRKGWRVKLSTDARGARYTGRFPHTVQIEEVTSASFARGGVSAKLLAPFKIGAGILTALRKFISERPQMVVGFGGYPTIPALSAAWLLRVPRMLQEQNGVLGRVNRAFAGRVNKVACGIWPTALPRGAVGVHTGNPVRASVLKEDGATYILPGDYPMSIVVIGGSQGARILSDVVPEAIALLPEDLRSKISLVQQARAEDLERVSDFYTELGVQANVQAFFDDIPARIANAQLVISRSGASSIADIAVVGRPSILIPFAAAAQDHQTANARQLVDAEAAILIPENRLAPDVLAEQIELVMGNPEAAAKMAAAARNTAITDATDRLVALVDELSGAKGQT